MTETVEAVEEDTRQIVAREMESGTKCTLDSDGYWTVSNYIHDRLKYDSLDSEWVEEKVEAQSIDRDCSRAIEVAMTSTLTYMADNVYKLGFQGLVEAKEYERLMKK